MRSAFVLALSFVSSIAFAYPNEKDAVEFTGSIMKADGTKSSVFSKLEIIEFLPERGEFLVRQEAGVDGSSWSKTEFMSEDSLLTREVVQNMLANCESLGGQTTSVIVPAGQFNSCALMSEDEESSGTVWLADVPFGLVQADTISKADGNRTILKLESVHFGKLNR